MRTSTSIYLDLVRFTAAMLVFLGHSAMPFLAGDRFAMFSPYMGDAVMVFFVLSGFVIAYATDSRGSDLAGYSIARLARVYSVALPAVALTLVLDSIGGTLHPEYYAAYAGNTLANPVLHHLLPVFFLNQLWYFDVALGSLGAYWSLCYEIWYYVAFGILMFSRGWPRVALLMLLGLFVGPIISIYFLVWLVGYFAYALCRDGRLGEGWGLVCCIGGLALLIGAARYGVAGEDATLRWFAPVLGDANIVHHLGVALGFALHLIGFNAIADRLTPVFALLRRPVQWLAGATFTIYLFHLPVMVFLAAIMPLEPGSGLATMVMIGGGTLIMFGIAEFTERRKRPWQALFTAIFAAARRQPAPALNP